MKCIEYKITICDSTMDFIHGGGRMIREVYCKDHDFFFNEEGHVFQIVKSSDRFENLETKEIDIPDEYIKNFVEFMETKKNTEKYLKNIFNDNEE